MNKTYSKVIVTNTNRIANMQFLYFVYFYYFFCFTIFCSENLPQRLRRSSFATSKNSANQACRFLNFLAFKYPIFTLFGKRLSDLPFGTQFPGFCYFKILRKAVLHMLHSSPRTHYFHNESYSLFKSRSSNGSRICSLKDSSILSLYILQLFTSPRKFLPFSGEIC